MYNKVLIRLHSKFYFNKIVYCLHGGEKMNQFRKLNQNTLAISMVIGTILMLAITVSLSATTYAYVSGSLDNVNSKSDARVMSMIDVDLQSHVNQLRILHITGDTFEDAIQFETPDQATPTDWWNGNWHKRVPFTVTSTQASSNFQLEIDVSYDNDMQQDFDDIRFIASDDSTVLSHWTETISHGSQATFWVKIPSLSVGENQLYLYYGNNGVSSSSNPSATFDTFVNFNVNPPLTQSNTEQDEEPTAYTIVNDYTIELHGNTWKGILDNIVITGDGSQILSFDYKSTDINSPEIAGVGFDTNGNFDSNTDKNYFYQVYGSQNNWGRQDHHDYSGSGEWKSYNIPLNDFSRTFDRFVIMNDEDDVDNTNSFYRNIRIHKSISSNPTVSLSFTNEETSTIPEPSYKFHNLEILVNDEPISYESIELGSGGTSLVGGDTLTITFDEVNMPSRGDVISVSYVPTNQLITVQQL